MIEYTVKVYDSGTREWYLEGQLHREDGPAIEWASGERSWLLNGELHRENGPAVERSNGDVQWWLYGNLHRTNGPALEYADGTRFWYLHGKEVTEQEVMKKQKPMKELTVAEIEKLLGHKVKIVK